MIEIGSVESTKISFAVLRRNEQEGVAFKFIAIESFPKASLREIGNKDFALIESKVLNIKMVSEISIIKDFLTVG